MIEVARFPGISIVESDQAESLADEFVAEAVGPEMALHVEPCDEQEWLAFGRPVLLKGEFDAAVDRSAGDSGHLWTSQLGQPISISRQLRDVS
jgi:hypothetical protein